MKQEKKILSVIMQISLIILGTIAFSYLMGGNLYLNEDYYALDNSSGNFNTNKIKELLLLGLDWVFNTKSFVSALPTVYTCLNSEEGRSCQEYIGEECALECDGDCIPSESQHISECAIGTCFDPNQGSCLAGSPVSLCEQDGGAWFDDPYENIDLCREGCCVLGTEALFLTERQCETQSNLLGFDLDYRADVNTELGCVALSRSQEEGACVFEAQYDFDLNGCSFTTKESCQALGGEFHSGLLCTHPDLETDCIKTDQTSCLDGKDGVYYLDSCGNPANVYDYSRFEDDTYWKEIIPLDQSCAAGEGIDCGNCDYLTGSFCQEFTDVVGGPTQGDYYCRDLSCVDKDGNARQHGESWCEYQGHVDYDEANNRAAAVPGSEHFRAVCANGETRYEPCESFRNGVCIESRVDDFAQAACVANRWQECPALNLEEDQQQALVTCEEHPDCFVKNITIDVEDFNFQMCAAKIPGGFDLADEDSAAGGAALCSMANVQCTKVEVKKADGDWECEANCDCTLENKFVTEMHDLCISLGDCGASVNTAGKLTKNYLLKFGRSEEATEVVNENFEPQYDLDEGYFSGLAKYAGNTGEYLKSSLETVNTFYSSLGVGAPEGLGDPSGGDDPNADFINTVSTTAGLAGTLLLQYASSGVATSLGLYSAGSIEAGFAAAEAAAATGAGDAAIGAAYEGAVSPGMTGLGGALAGAAIGAAVVSLVIDWTGIGAGLDEWLVWTLVGAGAVGGALVGYAVADAGSIVGAGCTGGGPIGCIVGIIILVVVLVVIAVLAIAGVGDTRERTISFACNAWQAPKGGEDCGLCGSDGLPCTKYNCQSLGQACQLINEGTGGEECIWVNPRDVNPPVISVAHAPTECVQELAVVNFSIDLDEPGECRFDIVPGDKFNDMQYQFSSSLLSKNHSSSLIAPTVEELGVTSGDPSATADLDVFVRCQDNQGNYNVAPFIIEMCVEKGEDLTPAVVTKHEPNISFVAYNSTEELITVWTNEPADCSINEFNVPYDQMEQKMTCLNAFEFRTIDGWRCESKVNITSSENEFFVRCLDQPWLAGNESDKRNENAESYRINLDRTTELVIDNISPDGETLVFDAIPVSVEVNVDTSGGLQEGAECKFESAGNYITFYDTFSNTHKQVLQYYSSGLKEENIECEDLAGNVVRQNISFTIDVDDQEPRVTRLYGEGEKLVVITDEPGMCYLTTEDCNFDLENATLLESSDGIRHSSAFMGTRDHFVRCEDSFGNSPSLCQAVVRPDISLEANQ